MTVTIDTNILQEYVEKRKKKSVVEALLRGAASGRLDLAVTSRFEVDTPWNPRKERIVGFLRTHRIPTIGSGFRMGYSRLGGYDMMGNGPGDIRTKLESIVSTSYPMWPPPEALHYSARPSHIKKPKKRPNSKDPRHREPEPPDWRDLDHLDAHYRAGRDKFVTFDRGILKLADELSQLGIVVISPEELLGEIEQ